MVSKPLQRTAIAALCLTMCLPLMAQAKDSPSRQARPMSGEQLEKFCEEEKRFTEPWIRWAGENRNICLIQATTPADRAACLETVRQQLNAHHDEHKAIILKEMRTLQPNHPVMQAILGRLRERERFASMALESDIEPVRLATARKESCLNQR